MLHQNVLLNSRIIELEEQLEVMTKRKARKRKRIQHGGTMEYGTAIPQAATEASIAPQQSKKARRGDDHKPGQLALRRCRNCGETGHNARTCKIDIEEFSKSDGSTIYIGSLFYSDKTNDS
jgi:hypothetical protein